MFPSKVCAVIWKAFSTVGEGAFITTIGDAIRTLRGVQCFWGIPSVVLRDSISTIDDSQYF